jgi:hypothetical protein
MTGVSSALPKVLHFHLPGRHFLWQRCPGASDVLVAIPHREDLLDDAPGLFCPVPNLATALGKRDQVPIQMGPTDLASLDGDPLL